MEAHILIPGDPDTHSTLYPRPPINLKLVQTGIFTILFFILIMPSSLAFLLFYLNKIKIKYLLKVNKYIKTNMS